MAEELRVLSRLNATPPNPQDMETPLLQMCRSLHSMMAANWVFSEVGRGRHFPEAHALLDRDAVVARVVTEIGCSQAEAETALAEKEELIEPLLAHFETAHQRINGKHLFFHVYQFCQTYVGRGITKDQLRNILARSVKERVGLPGDIRTIIEQRVLA